MKKAISRKFVESLLALENVLDMKTINSYSDKIRLDFENKILVATNGFALAQRSIDPNDLECFTSSITLEFAKDAIKTLLKDKKNTSFYVDTDEWIFGSPTQLCKAFTSDYYPAFQNVLLDENKCDIEFCLDFDVLKDLVASIERNNDTKLCTPITFKLQSQHLDSPVIVRHGDVKETHGKLVNVIMGRKAK